MQPFKLSYGRFNDEYDVVDRKTGAVLGHVAKVTTFGITAWTAWSGRSGKIMSSQAAGRWSSRAAAAQAVYDHARAVYGSAY